jgi:3-oxoacyl-[acyl-carrier-protein] synthase-3
MAYPAITGWGFHVPAKVVKNDDLKAYFDTSDEWIFERSGIRERRFVDSYPTGPSDLAIPAVEQALAKAGITKEDLDLVVFATLSPEAWFPGSGCFLQAKMDLPTIPALDIRMQCSGFIYGLSIAEQYIKTGMYRTVLVVGAEVQSTSIDYSDDGRTVGVLFGDGAGAVVVQASDELWVPEPTSTQIPKVTPGGKGLHAYMNGREVFKHAVVRMKEAIEEALTHNGWQAQDVGLFIPHQANYRIAEGVANQLGVSMERFLMNIHKYGNTTAASIPIALAEAEAEGRIQPGDKVLLTAFGSGFTWASAALVW